ncbi:hypothetical protein F4805DRAFT_105602 [Annulohypoxylon moriforme]|nr:hypothetical protein F4805DRAFT_105602 [Annulohypoxylon moriforme]
MSSISSASDEADTATLVVSFLVIILAVVSGALRFYTRIFTKAGLGPDDWMMTSAMILAIIAATLLIWGNVINPDGIAVSNSTDPDYVYSADDVLYFKITYAILLLYYAVTSATKLGVLFMYSRIFSVNNFVRNQIYVLEFLVAGWWLGCTITCLTGCKPFSARWGNGALDPNKCYDLNIFWAASGACEVFLDILILSLPIIMVARMNIPLKQKLLISGIFLLGGLSIATGLVKVILGYSPGTREMDYSTTEVWSAVHGGTAIVSANLPVFKPLYDKVGKHLSEWRHIRSCSSSDSSRGHFELGNIGQPSNDTSAEDLWHPHPPAWSKGTTNWSISSATSRH